MIATLKIHGGQHSFTSFLRSGQRDLKFVLGAQTLTRPEATLSPSDGEGRGEGSRSKPARHFYEISKVRIYFTPLSAFCFSPSAQARLLRAN